MLQFQSSPVGLSIEHGKVFRTATYLMYDQTREYGLKIEGHAKGGPPFCFRDGEIESRERQQYVPFHAASLVSFTVLFSELDVC